MNGILQPLHIQVIVTLCERKYLTFPFSVSTSKDGNISAIHLNSSHLNLTHICDVDLPLSVLT